MRILAVDWSGKLKRAEESLWLAEVRDGHLVDLRSGLAREQLVSHLVAVAEEEPRTVVGLDFAFSFPNWWCAEQDWSTGHDVWAAMAEDGERLLDACDEPFWGRPGKANPLPRDRLYRRTEREKVPAARNRSFRSAVRAPSVRDPSAECRTC